MEIWLNKLLDLTVFGVRCSDCYVRAVICTFFGGSSISEVSKLNNVGDRTPSCGTPVLIHFSFESVPLY